MIDLKTITIGDELPPLIKEAVSEIQLAKYAGASGDFNPLHYMDSFAKAAGQGGVIAHGMLIMGFAGQAVTGWVPRRSLKKFRVRFVNVTRPGDAITVSAKVSGKSIENGREVITCDIAATDQNGQVKLTGSFEAWAS